MFKAFSAQDLVVSVDCRNRVLAFILANAYPCNSFMVRYVRRLTTVLKGLVSYSVYLKELVFITITQETSTALIWMMTLTVQMGGTGRCKTVILLPLLFKLLFPEGLYEIINLKVFFS